MEKVWAETQRFEGPWDEVSNKHRLSSDRAPKATPGLHEAKFSSVVFRDY